MEAIKQKLVQAAFALYRGRDDNLRREADKWITQFQYTVEAWVVADALLQLPDNEIMPELQFLAAQTINVKIRYDFGEQLPREAQTSLRDSLLRLLVRHSSKMREKHAVIKQLSLAIVALGLQMEQWQTMIQDLAKYLGGDTATMPCLIELLEVIPEEHDKGNTSFYISENRYAHIRNEMVGSSKDVIDYLVKCLTVNNRMLEITVFRCLRSWVTFVQMSGKLIAQSGLIQFLFQSLQTTELFEDSINALTAIMHAFRNKDNLEDLEVIQMIIPGVVKLREVFLRALNEEDHEIASGIGRLFTNMAEAYLPLILGNFPLQHSQILDLVVLCMDYPSHEIAENTFYFWQSLIDSVLRIESEDASNVAIEHVLNYLKQMVHKCLEKLELGREYYEEEITMDEKEDLDYFRRDIIDLLSHSSYVLTGASVLFMISEELKGAAVLYADNVTNRPKSWPKVEARIYAFDGIFEVVPFQDEKVSKEIRAVHNILVQLPNSHPKLRETATRAIAIYTPWLSKQTGDIRPVFDYVAAGMDFRSVEGASAMAIKRLCKDCYAKMADFGAELFGLVNSQKNISVEERLDIVEGLAFICSHQSFEKALQALTTIAEPACVAIENVSAQDAGQVESKIEYSLDVIVILIRHAKPKNKGSAHPFSPILQRLWPQFEKLIRLYLENQRIIEKIVKVFKDCIRGFEETFVKVLKPTLDLLITSYNVRPVSSFMYAARIAIEKYGDDPNYHGYFVSVLNSFCTKTFTFLTSAAAFAEHPHEVEDLFNLADRALAVMPDPFVPLEVFQSLFQAACYGSRVEHSEASRSLLLFLENALLLCVPSKTHDNRHLKPFVDRALAANGQVLMNNLISGIAGHLPHSRLYSRSDGSLEMTLDALLRYLNTNNEKLLWLSRAMESEGCKHVNKELASWFCNNLVRAHTTRDSDYTRVIEEFSDRARLRLKRSVET